MRALMKLQSTDVSRGCGDLKAGLGPDDQLLMWSHHVAAKLVQVVGRWIEFFAI